MAGLGEAGPADDVWAQLTRLLPQDDAAVQEELEKQRQADEAAGGGGGSQPGSQPPSRAGSQPLLPGVCNAASWVNLACSAPPRRIVCCQAGTS